LDANDDGVSVPEHDVLCAGFPCQPFSKSGAQRGMDETRGTLFWNILRVIQERQPSVVLLENVRNLAGPRHRHEWETIVATLRDEGYRVSDLPAVFSPHLMPRELGGRPQVRERVFITATKVHDPVGADLVAEPAVCPRPIEGWDPRSWQLEKHLPLEADHVVVGCELSSAERLWIDAWDDFVQLMWEARPGRPLPGFPLWVDEWRDVRSLRTARLETEPRWKANFLVKNAEFYTAHKDVLKDWRKRWKVRSSSFPASRRKFEWQAQDTPSLWDAVVQMRPSGIRAKAPTYLPALVAITQTSILGPRERRLSPREAARMQGLPDWFDFADQSVAQTYRQLGNGVSVGAVWYVLRQHASRDADILRNSNRKLWRAILSSPDSPDPALEKLAAR
jgi:DNA (cytosine-5)-methyltransferase 1